MQYWDMTYGEIVAAIDAFSERQKLEQDRIKADMQVQAVVAYRQANLIGAVVAKVLGDKHKLPSLSDAFPGVFPEEMLRQKQQDWRVMKDRVAAHGEAWKRKRGESQHGDDRRGTASTDNRRNQATQAKSQSSQKAT